METALDSLEKLSHKMAIHLAILLFTSGLAYTVVLVLLRLFKDPKVITKFIASIAFAVTFYLTFVNLYITGLA